MSWVINIDFQDGGGTHDISSLVLIDTIRRNRTLHKNLKPTVDTLKFKMHRNTTYINSLLTNPETLISVTKDGSPYFTGTIRPNFKVQVEEIVGQVPIECVGYAEKLKKKINTTFAYIAYKISNSTTKSTSIVHQLLVLAGFDVDDDISIPTIDKLIDYFVNIGGKDSRTYWDVITKLLFEFGYVWYFDESGVFKVWDFLPTDTSTSDAFDNTDMRGKLTIQRKLEDYKGVNILWYPHRTETGAIVFTESTGGSGSDKCNIEIAADGYYPDGSGTTNVYSEYEYDGHTIIAVFSAALDVTKDAEISSSFTSYYRRALVQFHNTAATAKSITKFDITGDVTYQGDQQKTRCLLEAGTEKINEIDTEFLTASADADKLAIGLARYYKYSNFVYTVYSETAHSLGAYVDVEDNMLGIDNRCVIVQIEDIDQTQGLKKYTLYGISDYSAETTSNEGAHSQPAPASPAVTAENPTREEVILVSDEGVATLLGAQTFEVDGDLVVSGGVAKSAAYETGVTGWQLDNDGTSEFNQITVRGTVYASDGEIGGWAIGATSIISDNGRFAIRSDAMAQEIRDAYGELRIITGWMGNAPAGWLNADGKQLDETDFGQYISGGNYVVADGARFENGDYKIQHDAAYIVYSPMGVEIERLGSLGAGDVGLDIGGMKFASQLTGGGGSDGTFEDTLTGGGGSATAMDTIIGGGQSLYGAKGLLYSMADGRLYLAGDAIIDGTVRVEKLDVPGLITAGALVVTGDGVSKLDNDSGFTTFGADDVEDAISTNVTTIDGGKITTGALLSSGYNETTPVGALKIDLDNSIIRTDDFATGSSGKGIKLDAANDVYEFHGTIYAENGVFKGSLNVQSGYIGYSGTGTIDDPDTNDQRVILSNGGIGFQKYNGTSWVHNIFSLFPSSPNIRINSNDDASSPLISTQKYSGTKYDYVEFEIYYPTMGLGVSSTQGALYVQDYNGDYCLLGTVRDLAYALNPGFYRLEADSSAYPVTLTLMSAYGIAAGHPTQIYTWGNF